MVKLPTKSFERQALVDGATCVVGLDEVGMGCLAGPVVVCAARFAPEFFEHRVREFEYVRDSKMLQASQREEFAERLRNHDLVRHAIAVIDAQEVDRLNIYQASLIGMQRALEQVVHVEDKPFVFLDGRGKIDTPHPQQAVIKGDQKVFVIAAASILAKVHRDAMMVRYAQEYPGYGFEQHKGYGTKLHRARIAIQGISPLHRRSFRL